jgi:hypothetical protein
MALSIKNFARSDKLKTVTPFGEARSARACRADDAAGWQGDLD